MPENRNRLRPKQIKFFVNDKEYELIRKKMEQMGTDNMRRTARKICRIPSRIKKPCYSNTHEITASPLRRFSSTTDIAV